MALRWIDGFAHYGSVSRMGNWYNGIGSSVSLATMPDLGTPGLYLGEISTSPGNGVALSDAGTTDYTYGVGLHVYTSNAGYSSLGGTIRIVVFYSDSGVYGYTVGINEIRVCIWYGNSLSATVLAAGPANIQSNTLYHMEVRIVQHAT